MHREKILWWLGLSILPALGCRGQLVVWDATSRKPVPDAQAYLHERGLTIRGDSTGVLLLPILKEGTYHLQVFAPGYRSAAYKLVYPPLGPDTVWLLPARAELGAVTIEESRSRIRDIEHPQAVTVLGHDFIRQTGQFTLAGALSALPGVQSITTGQAIAKPAIRGLGFNRVAVFDHGIRQEGQQWGADHGLEVDAPGVERVEVIKGPAAILYGGDAIGGVISLQPVRHLAERTLSLRSHWAWRSVNKGHQYSLHVKTHLRPLLVSGGFSAQDFADFRVPSQEFTFNGFRFPLPNSTVLNTAGRERSGRLTLGIVRSWGYINVYGSLYTMKVGFFPGAHGIPTPQDLISDRQPRNIAMPAQNIRHGKVILNSHIRIGRHWLACDIGLQHNRRQELSLPHSHGLPLDPQNTVEHQFDLTTLSGQFRFHQQVSSRLEVVYAFSGQHRRNDISGFGFLLPRFRDWEAGLSALAKWHLRPGWFAAFGLRGDAGHIRSDPHYRWLYDNGLPSVLERAAPSLNRRFGNVSASAGFSRQWNPHHLLKLNLGTGFRMPTAAELTANGMHHGTFRHEKGDSTLHPERSLQLDAGYTFSSSSLSCTLSAFFNYFFGFIYLNPSARFSPLPEAGIIWQYEQADGLHTGFEADLEYQPFPRITLGLAADFLYTLNPLTGYSFPLMPPPSARIRAEYTLAWSALRLRYTPGAEVRLAMPQYFYARNELFTPGYALLHLTSRISFTIPGGEISLLLRVDNLFNARYFSHLSMWRYLGLPEPGRNFLISLSIPFQTTWKSGKARRIQP
ncbi:MAG: TonB-dependent receptor [Flavobacteriales bacterium]|nr:TonB-dependent receptor [Flavobacteriales bacterium]